jgi:hypothetical protein
LKPATQRSLPRIEAMMFRLGGLVKRTWISGMDFGLAGAEKGWPGCEGRLGGGG